MAQFRTSKSVSSRLLSLFLLTIAYLISLYSCNEEHINTFNYSICYVLLTIVSFISVWLCSHKQLNLYILYLFAFSLFIGGRFWVGLVDNDVNLFTSTFFFSYDIKAKEASELMFWVYSYLYFSTLGYVLSRRIGRETRVLADKSIDTQKCESFAKLVFPVILICILYESITGMIETFTHGYGVSLDDVTGKEYNKSFIKVINSFLGVMMLAFTYVYAKSQYSKYLKLYGVYGILVLLGGSRFSFASILLIFIWLYSKEKNIGLSRIAMYGMAGVAVLLVLFALSARGAGLEGFSIFEALEVFMYSTGGSLMIFHASTLVHGYPWIAYVQTFIPGSTLIYSKLAGESLHMQNLTFQGHMCYNLNPELYSQGAGLGWTSLSDLYLYSGGFIITFCILAYCFGFYFAFLENKADRSPKFRFVLIAISQGVLMMPRGNSTPMFVGVIYALVFVYLVKKYLSYRDRKRLSIVNNGSKKLE